MSPIHAPADKRFRRAHVKPTRRRKLRGQALSALIRLVVLAAVGYGIYRGGLVAANAHVLSIDRVVVTGNRRFSSGEVLALTAGLRGESLMWSDLGVWRDRLLASPWVKDAALRRSLPSTIEIALTERDPVAVARLDSGLYLVDDEGIVMDEYGPQYADLDLPIVDGLAPRGKGSAIDPSRADLAARLLSSVAADPALAKKLSQIDVANVHNASVILSGDPAVLYVGDDRFLPRLQSYVDLAAALRERVPDIDYVDLRFDDRIYVRPSGKAGKKGAVVLPAGRE